MKYQTTIHKQGSAPCCSGRRRAPDMHIYGNVYIWGKKEKNIKYVYIWEKK